MKASNAVVVLRTMRSRLEAYHGLVQSGPKEMIALAYAFEETKDPMIALLINFAGQGIVFLPVHLYETLRHAYKTLEALPADKEFRLDPEKFPPEFDPSQFSQDKSSEAVKSQPGKFAQTFENSLKDLEDDNQFINLFKSLPKEDIVNEPPKNDTPKTE